MKSFFFSWLSNFSTNGSIPPAAAIRRDRLRECRQIAKREARIAAVAGGRSKQIGALHHEAKRTVSARGLAEHTAVRGVGKRPEVLVHERDELVADVILVRSLRRRVHILAASETSEAVGEHEDRRLRVTAFDHRVETFG